MYYVLPWSQIVILRSVLFFTIYWYCAAVSAGRLPLPALAQATNLYQHQSYDEAIELLQQIVHEDKHNADAWALLGASHRDNWNKNAAMQALQTALKIDRRNLDARQYLGELYIMLGSLGRARKQLKKIRKICPHCDQTFQLTLMIQNAESGFCRFIPKSSSGSSAQAVPNT